MKWETVIGLEIHAQLATRSKIFSGAPTVFGAPANSQACAIDLGMPGVLPVLNHEAVRMAIMFGLATHSSIAETSVFARKNYFYPDLPKGYQISQYELPIVALGYLDIELENETIKRIGITRAHLEEDAGKSIHDLYPSHTAIDLNRAGTPLLEIVSEPDLRSAKEAVAYMRKLHSLVRYLGICDGNMQEGSFRCDANVSIRPVGSTGFGVRTETKNLNSFRFVEKAIEYEIERQIDIIESGGAVSQETRLYDPNKDETRPMRSKEEANDYRYFPDPDLLPVKVSPEDIEKIRSELPELPDEKKNRFTIQYQLSEYDAGVLTATRDMANFFEETIKNVAQQEKLAANWIMGDLSAFLNRDNIEISNSPVSPKDLSNLLNRISDGTISGKIAKEVFESMWSGEGTADEIIQKRGLIQISDQTALMDLIDDVLARNPEQLEQYRAGKVKLFGFFVGQAMKASQGKANPKELNTLLKNKLDS